MAAQPHPARATRPTRGSSTGSIEVPVQVQFPQSDDGRCKVMVVEDDVSSRTALLLLLKHFGFEGAYAGSVSEAVRLLTWEPRAMILDLMLPDGNGSEVLERVRDAGLPIRVAVATGAHDWRKMVDEPRLKPDVVFQKPLDLDRLVKWLTSVCDPAN